MKIKYKVPETLLDIKVKDYVKFIKAVDGVTDEEIIRKFALSIFCNITDNEAKSIPAKDLLEINSTLVRLISEKPDLVNTFKIGGLEYGLIPDWDKISFGELADLMSFHDGIKDMASLMAIMYRPVTIKKGDSYDIAKYDGYVERKSIMEEVSVGVGLGLIFFCKRVYEQLTKRMNTYSPQVLT